MKTQIKIINNSTIKTEKIEKFIEDYIEKSKIDILAINIILTEEEYRIIFIKESKSVGKKGKIINNKLENLKFNLIKLENEIDILFLEKNKKRISSEEYSNYAEIYYDEKRTNEKLIKSLKKEIINSLIEYPWSNQEMDYKTKVRLYIIGTKAILKIDKKRTCFVYFNEKLLKEDNGFSLLGKLDELFLNN
jgi:hypothetical protein